MEHLVEKMIRCDDPLMLEVRTISFRPPFSVNLYKISKKCNLKRNPEKN